MHFGPIWLVGWIISTILVAIWAGMTSRRGGLGHDAFDAGFNIMMAIMITMIWPIALPIVVLGLIFWCVARTVQKLRGVK